MELQKLHIMPLQQTNHIRHPQPQWQEEIIILSPWQPCLSHSHVSLVRGSRAAQNGGMPATTRTCCQGQGQLTDWVKY